MTFFQWFITPLLALLGTALGVINLWLTLKSHRTRVVVNGSIGVQNNTDHEPSFFEMYFGVEVVNQSYFAVTVREFGLWIENDSQEKRERYAIKTNLDKRIDSRSHCNFESVLSWESVLQEHGGFFACNHAPPISRIMPQVKGAYAVLSDGCVIYGKEVPYLSEMWNDYEEQIRSDAEERKNTYFQRKRLESMTTSQSE